LVTKEYATENRDKTIKDRAALPAKVICHYLDPPEGGDDKQFKLSEPDPRLRRMLPVVQEVRAVVGSGPPPTQTSSGDDEQDETPGEAGPSLGRQRERGMRASGRRSCQEPSELPPEGRLESDVDDFEAWISCVVTDGDIESEHFVPPVGSPPSVGTEADEDAQVEAAMRATADPLPVRAGEWQGGGAQP